MCLCFCLLLFAATGPVYAEQAGDQTPVTDAESTTNESDSPEASEPETEKKRSKKEKDPNRGRFLPIPVFITEPAIGDGLGLVLAYFHKKKDIDRKPGLASPDSIASISEDQSAPPTVTGIMGAYTSNKTAAAGIGHMDSFKNDSIRFTGLLAYADVNSTFYLLDQPFKFNLKGLMVYQETRFRIKDSKWFLGFGLSYLDANNSFRVELPDDSPINLFGVDLKNVGLSGKVAWDTRDNTSMPNSGQFLDFGLWRYDQALSGDYDYWNAKLKALSFHSLHERFVLGLRLEYSIVDGAAPFFAYPWVSLRGIPAMRYQGDSVLSAEVEGRFYLSKRWAVSGFAGTGGVSSDLPVFDTEQSIYSYGVGARFKIFEAQNIWVGVDLAKGPEDYNYYIKVGQSW